MATIRNYADKTRELLNGARTESEITRLLTFIIANEAEAIAKAEKAIFGRKTKLDEIAQLHNAAIELAKGAIAPYEELKKRWESIEEPEYEFTESFSQRALERNTQRFKNYIELVTNAVGDWFMSAKFANDPYAFVAGDALAPIPFYTVSELIAMPVEENHSYYPEHSSWASSLPYGAYLIREWFGLMSLNRNGLFDSYFVERAGVRKASDELYELVKKLE